MIATMNKTTELTQTKPLIYRDAVKGLLVSLAVGVFASGVLASLVLLLI